MLRHHAGAIRRWSAELARLLHGEQPQGGQPWSAAQRERWLQALAVNARQAAATLAERCLQRFPDARSVLDVAGGHGEYGLEFARRGLTVTVQDRPEVVELVQQWPAVRASGVELFAADVFEQLPDDVFDLVLCAGFSHTQPRHRVAELLARLRGITATDGGLAIHTMLREQRPIGPLFAVQMLVVGAGGDTHGLHEYEAWLSAANYGPAEHVDVDGRSLILAPAAVRG